jgi:hypothetical protein
VSARLKFDPLDLPHGIALSPEDGEFFKWFARRKEHHEFREVEQRLAGIANTLDDVTGGAERDVLGLRGVRQWNFEFTIFRHAWRAATWRPDMHEAAILSMLENDPENRLTDNPLLLQSVQHGPFFYKAGVNRTRRLPTAASMLAAQIACTCKLVCLPIDWIMVSKLIAVAEIDDQAGADSLRVRAMKIVKSIDDGAIRLVAWPQDTGPTLQSLEQLIARRRAAP